MAEASQPALPRDDPEAVARLHAVLRFAVGTAASFVLCEIMGWYPTFLAPLFAALLLANLPTALPPRAGLALIIVEAGGAYAAYTITFMLLESPFVLFGVVGLVLFLCFANLTRGASLLPILLVLISFATVPIVTLVLPEQAAALPWAFTRGMAIAVVAVWVAHAVWPKTVAAKPPAPIATHIAPVPLAAAGTAIVLPLMLVYLMFGITDALPVLITTTVLVVNFDPRRGAVQAAAMMIGNFIGGVAAVFAMMLLRLAPDVATLSLVALLIGIVFAQRIGRGGPAGAVALVTFNQTMVMFSLALIPGGADTGLWLTRLVQFGIASLFAVGMMTLLLPRAEKPSAET